MISKALGKLSDIGKSAFNYGSQILGSKFGQSTLGGIANIAGDFVGGLFGHHFGKKSARYSAELDLANNKEMARYMTALQKKYNEWLLPYENDLNYQYQLRYTQNSPAAQVTGLRDAGLNPILAAGGGFHAGSMPTASASSIPSGPSISSKYTPSSRKGIKLFDPMLAKQLELVDAQIEGQKIRNNNEAKNMGLTGRDATVARLASELGLTPDKLRSFLGFDFNSSDTSDNRPSDRHTYKFLGLNKADSDKVGAFFHFLKHRPSSPIVDVSKAPDLSLIKQRYGNPAGNAASYKAWLAHPSNSSRRSHTWAENQYLFKRDIESGLWRKKRDGKYGYK